MIIATLREGGKTRRYVVDAADEPMFAGIDPRAVTPTALADLPLYEHPLFRVNFGGQWLRGPGRIDEQYRSLAGESVVAFKITPSV